MATTLEVLAALPLVVRQQVALELHEAAERCADRLRRTEDVLGLDGAVDLLAQQETAYRALVRLIVTVGVGSRS